MARSTVLAIIIGTYLRLIELSIAALLHDIGMTKLPPEFYKKSQALTEQERKLN
jgi:HD-GYP domain-containing protein (c-di-GMP phosphodiesterase class II)